MSLDILRQVENINRAIAWVRKNKPADYEVKFLEMVEERRKLLMIADAAECNPGIAAYGVSQVGKSYLMNCMLQKEGRPFLLEANGRTYKFIEEMNPKTKNTEATGVVTRFTSFSNAPERYSKEYPILMRCLSVTDIILILSDGYYNDVRDYTSASDSELTELATQLYDKYSKLEPNPVSPIQPDDILTIKSYFKQYINNAQSFKHTSFFNTLSLIADRIPSSDWLDVFSTLWNKSPFQTKLFTKMVGTLAKFKYAKYVYLPPEALLHDGINENTVMSVQCLNELFTSEPKHFTDVYLRNGESFTKLSQLTKSEVCAVCAEIIVKIGQEYLDNAGRYCFDCIAPDVQAKLSGSEVKMTILNNNDMLDFPGARSRIKETLETLHSDLLLTNVFLRGKVAYLFNKYNEAKKINILLYCHHGEKNEVTDVPLLLNNWIMNNVGDTMEKRRKTLSMTSNISPLFYIGTKFNIDMEQSAEEIANSTNALNERWNARFTKVLYKECFNVDGNLDIEKNKIFMNWTRPDEPFQNSYILRDFKYSGPMASKLYDQENTPAAIMTMPADYYRRMRETFITSEHVKRFFANPALSWDVCSSINNDGTLYIIENLSKIADTMALARQAQFDDVCRASLQRVINSIIDYLVSTDTDEILRANIRQANGIFREFEFTCQANPEYFGHLLQALQLSESVSFKHIHKLIPDLISTVTGDSVIKDYELIRKRCNNFESCRNEDDKWDMFVNTYHFTDRREAAEYLSRHSIDPAKLFSTNTMKRKNSAVIAHSFMNLWKSAITSVQFMNKYAENGLMDQSAMYNLVNCLISTAGAIQLEEYLQTSLAGYTDVLNVSNINENLVADMISTTISDFVTDFGYSHLDDEKIASARRLASENRLPCFDWISRERQEHFEEAEITQLFNEILDSSERFTPSYDANYNCWLEFMYIAFIAHINVPEFDRDANDALKTLLDDLKK